MSSHVGPLELKVLGQPQKLLELIVKNGVRITKASSGSIMLLNPNTGLLDIEASVGLSEKAQRMKLQQGEGITGWVANTGRPCLVNDVRKDRRYVQVNPSVRSELAVPLELSGQVVGILNIDSDKRDAFHKEDKKHLIQLAKEAAAWLQHSWEVHQLRIRAQQLESLVDMSQTIISEDALEETLNRIAQDAAVLMRARLASIMLIDEDSEMLVLKACHGAPASYLERPNLSVRDSLVGVVIHHKKHLTVLNVQDNQHYQHTELARREGLVSLLSVPLVFHDQALGVLSVYTDHLHRFSNEEIRLLSAMAELSAIAIAKAKLLEKIVKDEEQLKASERLSALGWLAAEIAHEIRNPLTVIQMLFHTMVHGGGISEGYQRDASLIEGKMKHMNKILDQVLAFARSSEPDYEALNPVSMIEDVALLVRHKLGGQKIKIKLKLKETKQDFYGDRAQLEQAILNLVLNAAHAMPKGGTLTLGVKDKKIDKRPYIAITVKDTGPGIPKEIQEDLFQPFLSHRKGGTGLGLALVHKTIQNHGGKISISSKKDKGTIFELVLPADVVPDMAQNHNSPFRPPK
ncbi:MAG: GAF domain-containing protein [Verrucomicrobiota bacterium]